MKKFLVFVSLMGVTDTVLAVTPEQPWLLTPVSATPLPLATPVTFTWANTKPLPKYRLIVSTTSAFSGYNQKTSKCNSSCFTTTLSKLAYTLSSTAAILKPNNNYYWRVEAINAAGGSSLSDIRAFAFGTPTSPIDPKFALAVMPIVTDVPPSPASVVQGTPITFAATLDIPLPTGYSVKVDYGNGLILMKDSGTGINFSYAATPSSATFSLYTLGIYDSKNVLKSNKVIGNFEVTPVIPPNVPPVLSLVSGGLTANVDAIYTVTLSATDANGDLRLITIDWGDGTSDSSNAADGANVTFSHSYNPAGSYTWTANAYDYSDAVSLVPVTQTVVVSVAPPVVPSTTATSASTTGCYTDSKTSLTWEVKTNDKRLHDKNWTYSWYEPDASKNGGYSGAAHSGKCNGTSQCNTYDYINAVNTEGLCGVTNWRLPTKSELESLVLCSDGLSTTLGANTQGNICTGLPTHPTIDTLNFPNTKSDWFWTSSTVVQPVVVVQTPTTTTATATTTTTVKPVTTPIKQPTAPTVKQDALSAWMVLFYDGSSHPYNKGNAAGVRLVSGK